MSGVFDMYWNRPFQIPAFDAFDVSPDILDRYVGMSSIAGAPAKMTVTRDGAALYIKAGTGQSSVPLEATAENTFKIDGGAAFEFDVEKGLLTITRGNAKTAFTKEK